MGNPYVGRVITLTWNGSTIGGVREKSISINGDPIDVTSDDDAGWRLLLSTPGQKQVDIKVSGVAKQNALKGDFFASNFERAVVITYADGKVLSGTFHLVDYQDTHPYKDAGTFEASLQSTGTVSYA